MINFDFIYELKPIYEIEPGWYKLRWRPIKNGTWNIWFEDTWHSWDYKRIGITFRKGGAHSGWGRDWDDFKIDLHFGWFNINLWIIWNIQVMAQGPMDVSEEDKKPLDLSGVIKNDR